MRPAVKCQISESPWPLGNDIGNQSIFQDEDLVLQEKLALFQALDLQLIEGVSVC
ncbi:hypothetical protein GALL_80120 [mine drainage metagenome]|uniref:Uncharacterized protein n=1 Tax=mine drainage metagenome TaxID=410659 RepID=A0A1J5T8F1_9ZZZZ